MQPTHGAALAAGRAYLCQKGTVEMLRLLARLIFAPGAPAATPYRINPGDQLQVLVWGDERLQRDVLVLPDGTFAFPLVGQVQAAGKLPSEIERIITVGLQPQYKGPVPQVTVTVKQASGYQFSVIGKVRNPGTFTPGRYVNALEALAIAGGPAEFANMGGAKIIRKSGDQLYVVPVRLQDALRGDNSTLSRNEIPRIESGDTLVVP
jgi:polysaccharide export outer membrane protein